MSNLWLANLPSNWKASRLKAVVTLGATRVTERAVEENYVGLENIEPWTGRLLDSVATVDNDPHENDKTSTANQFETGDILFGKLRPYLAKAHLAKASGICTTELLVLKNKAQVDGRFLLDVILTPEFISQVNAETFGARMPRADWDTISNMYVPLPPLAEQRAIADYLDRETAKIDMLIAAKQRLLDLLAEKRRALITHAVTCGLDANAPLRNSGVEWLGEIPTCWQVVRIKNIAQVGNGSTPFRDNESYWLGGTFPWLTSTVVNSDIVQEPTEFVTDVALRECHLPIVRPNSILVAITGEGKTRGKAALLPYCATINQHMAFISPHEEVISAEFMQLFLASSYGVLRMISEGTGSTKGALTCEQLSEFSIPLPPLQEQIQIVSHTKAIKARLDKLTLATEKTIGLLLERRTALIAAGVTGKLQH